MPAALFTKSTSAEPANDSGLPMGLCRNMGNAAKNVSLWNSIQPTKAFGTTFTPFPGQVPRRVWPIHTRELCKNALQQIQKRPCAGQRNAKEISTGCNLRQEEFFR